MWTFLRTSLISLVLVLGVASATPTAALAQTAKPTTSSWVCIPLQAQGRLLADDNGWSISHLFRGMGSRSRIIQICAVAMVIAIAIIMKK